MSVQAKFEPITKTMTVARGQEETFRFYTERLDDWWPKKTHSIGLEKAVRVAFEPRVGGRIFETQDEGTEVAWGEISVWDAPRKIVHSWHLSRGADKATEVEITFTALGESETRVDLVHRNWENLGEEAERLHGDYDGGWDHVFGECFGGLVKA